MMESFKKFENIETGEEKNFSVDFQSGPFLQGKNQYHFARAAKLIKHKKRIFREAHVFFLKDAELETENPLASNVAGKAFFKTKDIILNYKAPGPSAERTLFHELWHQVSKHKLTDKQRQCVYSQLQIFGEKWNYEYLDKPDERAARAFEAYASARAHGLNLANAHPGTAHSIFEAVYDGKLAELEEGSSDLKPLPRAFLVAPGLILALFGLIKIFT